MPQLKSERRVSFYRCGRCKGKIRYEVKKGRPKVCTECGYGHGTRDVGDIPSELRLSLSGTFNEAGSRGITEQSTITSR